MDNGLDLVMHAMAPGRKAKINLLFISLIQIKTIHLKIKDRKAREYTRR